MNGDRNAPGASTIASAKSFTSLTALNHNSLAGSSSFAPPTTTATTATKNAMAASAAFLPPPQPLRSSVTPQPPYPSLAALNRDVANPIGSSFPAAATGACIALIRRLPLNTSEESLRLMMVFSKELLDVHVMAVEQSPDAGFRAAVLKFKTLAGAQEAKKMLDGKSNISNDADMIVDIISASPTLGGRYSLDATIAGPATTASSSADSSAASSRQSSRFNGNYQPLEKLITSSMNPSMNGIYAASDLAGQEQSVHFQNIFSPQSPIGNHLTEQRTRVSGKTLINEGADDDETGELLKDPVAYAENGPMSINQRRSTVPAIPVSRLAALSLNTTAAASAAAPATMTPYGRSSMTPLSAHSGALSPTIMGGAGPPILNYNQMYRAHNFPPANPADQNPPCNTLYVGNLPIDTSEEELKAMFSKQRGYKRLCFRTKQNGPMCFVEFEDVSAATKALHELYGHPLHNSIKGGIRLSFSKNPLGVRSNQNPGQLAAAAMVGMNPMLVASAGGFTTASGPPPGLTAPPGLVMNRPTYPSGNGLGSGNSSPYNSTGFSPPPSNGWNLNYPTMAAGRPTSMLATASSGVPPHMMGR